MIVFTLACQPCSVAIFAATTVAVYPSANGLLPCQYNSAVATRSVSCVRALASCLFSPARMICSHAPAKSYVTPCAVAYLAKSPHSV